HTTKATIDLCSVMLPDAAHIQEMEVEQLKRRNAQRGKPPVEPIYRQEDAAACMTLFRAQEYGEWASIAEGLRARFWNAGHLLGSASVELEIDEERQGAPLRIVFSGDIGPGHKLLQTDPEGPAGIDYLIANPPMAIANAWTFHANNGVPYWPTSSAALPRRKALSSFRPSRSR